jgi:hypothetical protein
VLCVPCCAVLCFAVCCRNAAKNMSYLVQGEGQQLLLTKGAQESVLRCCCHSALAHHVTLAARCPVLHYAGR